MTYQEAISILETNAINATGVLGGLPQTAAEKSRLNQQIEAFDMAIDALEKQIPKKPYIQQDDRNNDCMECPSCDSFIGYEYDCRDGHYQINYCNYCGQKLDWSEEE